MFGLLSKGSPSPWRALILAVKPSRPSPSAGRPGKVTRFQRLPIPMPRGTLVDYQLFDIERVSRPSSRRKRDSCRGLPERGHGRDRFQCHPKIIQVDTNINESELENQVHLRQSSHPFPLDEVSLDFEILGMAGDNGRQEVLLSAARTESVSGRVSALTEAGMTTMVGGWGPMRSDAPCWPACPTCKPRRNRLASFIGASAP